MHQVRKGGWKDMTQYTQEDLFEKGMWNCLDCGHINCLEDNRCDKCLEDKFIFRERNAPKKKSEDFDVEPTRFPTAPLFNFHSKPRLRDRAIIVMKTNPYKNDKIAL